MQLKLKWSFGNQKVSKLDAVSFGLPAYESIDGFKTCPQAGACAAVCYARQGRYRMPNVAGAREFNLARIRGDLRGFIVDALEDLQSIKQHLIRVHDSGDFFSQDYLDAWVFIARKTPAKTFYAYTKSLHLDFSHAPKNLRITQSQGGKLDREIDKTRPHSRIFSSLKAMSLAGYRNGTETDTLAIKGETRIGLLYHGQRNLTEGQKEYFK